MASLASMALLESFIQRKVYAVHQDTHANRAARAMCERNIGCVIVTDMKGDMVGIVTDRDLTCSLLAASKTAEVPLSEVMTPNPQCVEETAEISDVLLIMEDVGVRRIPVVQRLGEHGPRKCVGLITLDDLVAAKLVDPEKLARIIKAQIWRRGFAHFEAYRRARAEARSEAHTRQTLNHFYKTIAENTQIPSEILTPVIHYLLGSFVRRLHYTGAAHFISQLPRLLQEDLLDLSAGPDRSINAESICAALQSRYGFEKDQAHEVLANFCSCLTELINMGQIEQIQTQLPEDLRALFSAARPDRSKDRSAA